MESSSRYIPKTFKKRVFRGSSLSYAEPNVIEIDPPSAHQSTKTKARSTQKEVEIINLDIDEDCNNVVFLGGNINAESNKKMKGIMGISLGSSSASKLDAKKAESNNKGKEVLDSSKSFDIKSTSIFDLDDYVSDDVDDLTLQAYFDNIDLPAGIKDSSYTLTNNSNNLSNNNNTQVVVNSPSPSSSTLAESSSSKAKTPVNDDALEKYQRFKKFDTVMDHSDHHYAMTQPHQKCAKSIQEEWRILENDLPDTIFVRVYESRMDLLRVVIIGAEGTPYHDGLFFFDVCFPSTYPDTPPHVHYRSGGLGINPNLFKCGEVCLSLLNTWDGGHNEMWVPGTSTMLQVLVSIQGLVLNMKPYFNEPECAGLSGSVQGEQFSLNYNEHIFMLSLKTMVYTSKNPPKNFEDLVVEHFRCRVLDILMACKAYTEGVKVGCLVKGGVQEVDDGKGSCSQNFKDDVAPYIKTLMDAFTKIGAKEDIEFSHLSVGKSRLPAIGYSPKSLIINKSICEKL